MEFHENSYKALFNKKFFSLLLDLSFDCYLKKEKDIENKNKYEQYYNQCKNIIINIYINSLLYASKKIKEKKEIFPSYELETIYIWGDKILMNEMGKIDKEILHSFLDEILYELLINFKINFEYLLLFFFLF